MMVEIHSKRLYKEISKIATNVKLVESYGLKTKIIVNTKYKIVEKKVKLMAIQLPLDFKDYIKKAKKESKLKKIRKIRHKFYRRDID